MSTENEVRKASEQFYAALNGMLNGDAEALSKIWSHESAVTTMHPIGGRQVGWDQVQDSWVQVAQLSSDGKVQLKDQLIRVAGDMACEVGTEHAEFKLGGEKVGGQIRVTNVYQREGGAWKIVHHHTDVVEPMVEILKRLQTASARA